MTLMKDPYTRRDFFKFCGRLAALFGGGSIMASDFAQAFMKITDRQPPVIWLDGQGCTGDSVSLVYGDSPPLVPFLTSLVDLKFHPTLAATQGDQVFEIINAQKTKGGYVLCFEGAVPVIMPEACLFGEQPLADLLVEFIEKAAAVIACGTCACYGGIPAANPETGAISIVEFAKRKNLRPDSQDPGMPHERPSVHRNRCLLCSLWKAAQA